LNSEENQKQIGDHHFDGMKKKLMKQNKKSKFKKTQ